MTIPRPSALTTLFHPQLILSGYRTGYASVTFAAVACFYLLNSCLVLLCVGIWLIAITYIQVHQLLLSQRPSDSHAPVLGADTSGLPDSNHVRNVLHLI